MNTTKKPKPVTLTVEIIRSDDRISLSGGVSYRVHKLKVKSPAEYAGIILNATEMPSYKLPRIKPQ